MASTYGQYKYSFTILPGILSYLTTYAKTSGHALLEGKPTTFAFVQHHYSVKHVYNDARKRALVGVWLHKRLPLFRQNLRFNLGMLEQILRRCRQRGVHAVLLELPNDAAIIGHSLDTEVKDYRQPVKALAAKYGVPYLDFNAQLAIPSADFYDLSHLVEPGRVLWQRELAKELVGVLDGRRSAGGASS